MSAPERVEDFDVRLAANGCFVVFTDFCVVVGFQKDGVTTAFGQFVPAEARAIAQQIIDAAAKVETNTCAHGAVLS